MTNQLITPSRGLDRNGAPQSGAKCYIYQSGTTTAVTVTDSAGTALAWPVVADIDGAFPQMFYAGSYALKAVVTASDGTILPAGTIDPVAIVTNVSTASAIAFTPTAEVPQTNVQAAVAAIGTAEVANTTAIASLNAATISGAGLATGSGTLPAATVITVTAASNAETIAGTLTTKAVTPAGFAAGLAAGLTTSTVLAATAGLTFGAIGSYGLFDTVSTATTYAVGGTVAGASLTWASVGAGGVDSLGSPSGTWRALSYKSTAASRVGLFVRIS